MTTELAKQFDHQAAEKRIYDFWEKKKVFSAVPDKNKQPFCVVIPPPNVTGILHMGHVLDNLPQDVMTRWHRMRGFAAVWIPGTDHAGIATQNVVERQLKKEGLTKYDLGREKFLERVWQWRKEHGGIIINQLKRLGCSCDWSRERFTMDEQLSRAVKRAFTTYYQRGLIYRGKRMINWCPRCGTALANDEVEHQDKKSNLWHLRYPLIDAKDSEGKDYIIVATTRPETMLGDTGVAVNPDDERYKNLVGKKVMLPIVNRPIPIFADKYVDPSFGTGLVKVTPAHDPNDYQMGLTHNLDLVTVIDDTGKMTADTGKYAGMDRFDARKKIIEELDSLGLLEKIEPYTHAVGTCYRCNTVIEPKVSEQWFVKMGECAKKIKQAVIDGRIAVTPDSEKHDFYTWLDNIQDWCISRQLWWGHRIPVYYCDECGAEMCAEEAPTKCTKCGSTKIHQDEDVLDTWFSSQLWPFSTLGWPDDTEELKYWYPTNWLMSGRDIIFFWDARMMMAGLELIGDVPFRSLSLHGLARDEQNRKLSKSLGNSPNPLDLFDQYGTDAIRATIAQHYPMGRQDIKLTDRVYQEGRAFVTKVWNAYRLIMLQLSDAPFSYEKPNLKDCSAEDAWIISRLGSAVKTHDEMLNQSDFAHAFEAVSNFFWTEYCDWYLELIKPRLRQGGEAAKKALSVALYCQINLLKLLHLYIPFVTEELWQTLRSMDVIKDDADCLALSKWPAAADFPSNTEAEETLNMLFSVVREARELRHYLQLPPKQPLAVQMHYNDSVAAKRFALCKEATQTIGSLDPITDSNSDTAPAHHIPCRFTGGMAFIKLPEDLDLQALRDKIEKKLAELDKAITGANRQLSNEAFVSSAPPAIVEETRKKAAEYAAAKQKMEEFKASL